MTHPYRRPLAVLATGVALAAGAAGCGGVLAAPAGNSSPSSSAAVSMAPQGSPWVSYGAPSGAAPAQPRPPEPSVPTVQSASYARIGETISFDHLSVTVVKFGRDDDRFALFVTTCVTKLPPGSAGTTMRLGAEAWSLSTSAGVETPVGSRHGGQRYPSETQAAVGQCVEGWLEFPVPASAEVTDIDYRNGLGEVGSWRPDL